MKIRLHGTGPECDQAALRIAELFDVRAISGPYHDRGQSRLVRVYIEVA